MSGRPMGSERFIAMQKGVPIAAVVVIGLLNIYIQPQLWPGRVSDTCTDHVRLRNVHLLEVNIWPEGAPVARAFLSTFLTSCPFPESATPDKSTERS